MPNNTACFREDASNLLKTSLFSRAENAVLSKYTISSGSTLLIPSIVYPSPLGYCSVIIIGMFKILAAFVIISAFFSRDVLLKTAFKSFSCTSIIKTKLFSASSIAIIYLLFEFFYKLYY